LLPCAAYAKRLNRIPDFRQSGSRADISSSSRSYDDAKNVKFEKTLQPEKQFSQISIKVTFAGTVNDVSDEQPQNAAPRFEPVQSQMGT
jgi:hypothetical protein